GVDRHLIRPCQQQLADILDAAHPAAHGERHEAHFRHARYHVIQCRPSFMRSGNIEKTQLIRALRIVKLRLLHRLTGVAQLYEIDAFDNAAVFHVKAGNDAGFQHSVSITETRKYCQQIILFDTYPQTIYVFHIYPWSTRMANKTLYVKDEDVALW